MSADERSRGDHRSGRGRKEQVNVSKLHLQLMLMLLKVKVKNYEKQQGSIHLPRIKPPPPPQLAPFQTKGRACPLGLCEQGRGVGFREGFVGLW